MKKLLILVLTLSIFLVACNNGSSKSIDTNNNMQVSNSSNTQSTKTFTLSELKKYNGQNGKPGYVAVEGVVYDVSSSPSWKGGKHKGLEAGNDLTKEIMEFSPHGTAVMKNFPIVGKLSDK